MPTWQVGINRNDDRSWCISHRKFSRPFITQTQKRMMWQRHMHADESKPRCGFGHVTYITISCWPFNSRNCGFAKHLKCNCPEIFVNKLFLQKFAVKIWPTFTKQCADAMFPAHQL